MYVSRISFPTKYTLSQLFFKNQHVFNRFDFRLGRYGKWIVPILNIPVVYGVVDNKHSEPLMILIGSLVE